MPSFSVRLIDVLGYLVPTTIVMILSYILFKYILVSTPEWYGDLLASGFGFFVYAVSAFAMVIVLQPLGTGLDEFLRNRSKRWALGPRFSASLAVSTTVERGIAESLIGFSSTTPPLVSVSQVLDAGGSKSPEQMFWLAYNAVLLRHPVCARAEHLFTQYVMYRSCSLVFFLAALAAIGVRVYDKCLCSDDGGTCRALMFAGVCVLLGGLCAGYWYKVRRWFNEEVIYMVMIKKA